MKQQMQRATIKDLAAKIVYHQDRYYNSKPEISDAAFDALWNALQKLAPDHPVLRGIGRDENAMYAKREHRMLLHSQDKVNSNESFTTWAEKSGLPSFLVQHKLDGISFELQYDNGKLVAGVSRGDGRVGDDLTHNAVRIPGIPFSIDPRFTGAVRGEIIMDRDVHRRHFPELANTRNTTSGIMKRKDGAGIKHLYLVCYDARVTSDTSLFLDELEKLAWLREQGFQVVETEHKNSVADVLSYREYIITERLKIPYDIDGLIIKGLAIDDEDSEKNRPEKQIAFKFDIEQAQTVLESIEWSKNGHRISPIALFRPVQLHGTRVKRANLVNLRTIGELAIAVGSNILISKRGEIIPKVESVINTPEGAFLPLPPYRCSDCGELFHWNATEIFCANPQCPSRALHRTSKWIQTLDIEGFGKRRVEKLFALGVLRDIPDLYTLQKESLVHIEKFGEQLAENLLNEIRNKSRLDLATCIVGFDIAGIGMISARAIVNAGHNTLDALEAVTVEKLCEIRGIGTILAHAFFSELQVHLPVIQSLVARNAVHIRRPNGEQSHSSISGKSFCFTGTLQSLSRKQAADRLSALGASVKNSVGQTLDYLVLESLDSQSSKAQKARTLGVTLLDETMFLNLLSD